MLPVPEVHPADRGPVITIFVIQNGVGAAFVGIGLAEAAQGRPWGYLLAVAGLVACAPHILALARTVAPLVHRPMYLAVVCTGTAVMGLCFTVIYGGWLRQVGVCLNVGGLSMAVWSAAHRGA